MGIALPPPFPVISGITWTHLQFIFALQSLEGVGAQDAIGHHKGDQHDVRKDAGEELPGHAEGGDTLAPLLPRGVRRVVGGH